MQLSSFNMIKNNFIYGHGFLHHFHPQDPLPSTPPVTPILPLTFMVSFKITIIISIYLGLDNLPNGLISPSFLAAISCVYLFIHR